MTAGMNRNVAWRPDQDAAPPRPNTLRPAWAGRRGAEGRAGAEGRVGAVRPSPSARVSVRGGRGAEDALAGAFRAELPLAEGLPGARGGRGSSKEASLPPSALV